MDEIENPEEPKKERELLIVQSKVREIIRAKDKRVSDEFINALSDHVFHTVEKAIARCAANKRSTLQAQDV